MTQVAVKVWYAVVLVGICDDLYVCAAKVAQNVLSGVVVKMVVCVYKACKIDDGMQDVGTSHDRNV